jgi:hypothetical protein
MKPNIKLEIKVDGEVFMEANIIAGTMQDAKELCDEICERIWINENCHTYDGQAIKLVEPIFRADE